MIRLLLAFTLLAAVQASAQVYRWVDEKGRVHYGEQPPQGVKREELKGSTSAPAAPTVLQRDAGKGPLYAPKGDPAAEAREKKAREDRVIREARERDGRKPRCEAAKDALVYAERNKLFHEKKGVLGRKAEFTNEEQREEIHARRTDVNQSCF